MGYIPDERQNIDIGDEFFIVNYSRHNGTTYDGPHPVTRVTSTQFSFGAQRFMRTTGRKVGSSTYGSRAERATAEKKAEANKNRTTRARIKKEERAKAKSDEQISREKYGAAHIDDAKVQKLLGSIRTKAEAGEAMMRRLLDVTDGASIDEPWNLYRELGSWNLGEKFTLGVLFNDEAKSLHTHLVALYDKLINGYTIKAKYDYDSVELFTPDSEPVKMLEVAVRITRHRAEQDFFSHQWDDDDAEQRAEWVRALRDIDGIEYCYASISPLEEA